MVILAAIGAQRSYRHIGHSYRRTKKCEEVASRLKIEYASFLVLGPSLHAFLIMYFDFFLVNNPKTVTLILLELFNRPPKTILNKDYKASSTTRRIEKFGDSN